MDRALKKAFGLLGVLAAFGSAAASGPIVLRLRLASHFPIVMAKVDGLDVPLVFDKGMSDPVVLEPLTPET